MNRINATTEKTVAEFEAEASRIRIKVKKAEAEAESKRLQGQGIATNEEKLQRSCE
jgi:hypothetical protein